MSLELSLGVLITAFGTLNLDEALVEELGDLTWAAKMHVLAHAMGHHLVEALVICVAVFSSTRYLLMPVTRSSSRIFRLLSNLLGDLDLG